MADNRARYGFRYNKAANGGKNCPAMEPMVVATGYDGSDGANSVDINIGDPVIRVAAGTAEIVAAGAPGIYGVVGGVAPYWDGSKMVPSKKLPNQTAWGTVEARKSIVWVIPARGVTFEADQVGGSNTTEAAYRLLLGQNVDHVLTGDTANTSANPQLGIATTSDSALQWRIVGISPSEENRDFSGANVKLLVQVNETGQAPAAFRAGI